MKGIGERKNRAIKRGKRDLALEAERQERAARLRVIGLESVRTDSGAQARLARDEGTVASYAGAIDAEASAEARQIIDVQGKPFPPVDVCEGEGGELWLADGFHRVEAAKRAGLSFVEAIVHGGGKRAAFVMGLGVNESHGVRRSRKDKLNAVKRALTDDELAGWSDSQLARVCAVTRQYVSGHRKRMEASGTIPYRRYLKQADGELRDRGERETAPAKAPERAASGDEGGTSDEAAPEAAVASEDQAMESVSLELEASSASELAAALLDEAREQNLHDKEGSWAVRATFTPAQ